MKALIERQLYHPAVVLPLLALMQLMVALDFNLAQVGLLMLSKGVHAALHRSRAHLAHRAHRARREIPCVSNCTAC